MGTNNLPNQALPLSQKDKDWQKQTIDAYIERAQLRIGSNSHKYEIQKLYDYYNGITHPEDYEYILKPYGGTERQNFPAKLRTYPLIKPAVDLLIGEKIKRPFNFSIILANPDVVTIKQEAKKEVVLENMYQWFINKLNESGVETGMEDEEVELPEHVEEIFERNWRDQRAIIAQKALNYLIPYLKWKEKMQKMFFDFLVSGTVSSHKGVESNEPFYRVLNPIEIDYDKDPNVDFIEDGNWVVIRELASRASIVDRFYKFLSKEQIDRIQNPHKSNRDDLFWYNNQENIFYDEWDEYAEVCSVYWKSLVKVGIRTYIDESGEEYEEIVDEDYIQSEEDISLEWYWVNEVWQGFRIDGDIMIDVKPVDVQRGSIDNPSKCKLPVNGRRYSDRNSTNISFAMLGIPFQVTYDIFKYRLEAAISRSKDLMAMLDINLIPEKWDMDKFMHIAEATGILWVDYAKEGVNLAATHQNVLDLSIKTIEQYINLLRYIKEEWEQVSGVTRQRMGEMSQYEGKATGEQSIIQSSHITEDLFRKFELFEERELQGIIDFAQLAWINGKKGMYVTPEGSAEYLEVDEDFINSEIGIFVSNSGEEQQKLRDIRGLSQVALEQGAPLSMIAEMIESDNFIDMKNKIKKVEELNEQAQQQAQELEQQLAEQETAEKQADRDHEKEMQLEDLQNKIELEMIKQSQAATNDEEWKKDLEQRKLEVEERIKNRDLAEKERNNKAKEEIERKKVQVQKQTKMSKNK